MKLNFEQIKACTSGAVNITAEPDGVHFYRFSEPQMQYCKTLPDFLYSKLLSTTGIKLTFETNSRNLSIRTFISPGSGRTYFSFDVFANGQSVGFLDNFSDEPLAANYVEKKYPLGLFEKNFSLGYGPKTVTIQLPWSVCAAIQCISLDDGSYIRPCPPRKKMLLYGDSISVGLDSLRSSRRYASRLAELLDAGEYNKAIGGIPTLPALAAPKESFQPDYVVAAYGTNDWSLLPEDEFRARTRTFYTTITTDYPNAKFFALTPIWRAECKEIRALGTFTNAEKCICDIAQEFPQITVISCAGFLPEDNTLFGDLRLHPSECGFDCYFNGLKSEILKAL